MSTATATVLRPDAAEVGLAVINRCIPAYADGMHKANLADLKREERRLEAMPPSRVTKTMRLIVDEELTSRTVDRG